MAAALELAGVRKAFGGLLAVDGVSFAVEPGEIFALVGENGAGKSTLMNLAYGLYRPDGGEIRLRGQRVSIDGPARAIALGIGMVHQHFMLVPTLSIAQNVVLGCEPTRRGLFDLEKAEAKVREVAERNGLPLDPSALVEQVSVGTQQRVEIVKALYRGAEILILDEPTAVLTPQEAGELLRVLRELARSGKSIIFISHRLKEILAVADRIGVMRRGKLVALLKSAEIDASRLADVMVGHTPAASISRPSPAPHPNPLPEGEGAPLLRVVEASALNDRDLPAISGLSFELFPGEILGVAGVDGNGQSELAELLTGLRPLRSGRVEVSGAAIAEADPGGFRTAGVAHIPEDRQRRGLVLDMSLAENFSLGRQDRSPFARGPFIDFEGRGAAAERLIQEYDVRPPNPSTSARALSGGNQQKAIVARELDSDPKIIVAVQPTRGLDIGAIATVHARLREQRNQGKAVVLISLDLEELLALCDRILVLHRGRSAGIVRGEEATELELGRMMLGQGSPPSAEATPAVRADHG